MASSSRPATRSTSCTRSPVRSPPRPTPPARPRWTPRSQLPVPPSTARGARCRRRSAPRWSVPSPTASTGGSTTSCEAEVAGHRQALLGRQPRRHPARRGQLRDLRRCAPRASHRVVPDGHPGRPGRSTTRVRRPRGVIAIICAVEPAAAADDVEGRARARLRQHRGRQAVRGDAVDRHAARRGHERRRRPRGRLQRRARVRAATRPASCSPRTPTSTASPSPARRATGTSIMKAAAADSEGRPRWSSAARTPASSSPTADLDAGRRRHWAASCFPNSGQVCLGTERVYVQRSIFDEVVDRLVDHAKSELKLRLPRRRGHQLRSAGLRRAPRQGAVLLQARRGRGRRGAARRRRADSSATSADGGSWVEPTIWTGLPHDRRVATEEIFGPCRCAASPSTREDEVIRSPTTPTTASPRRSAPATRRGRTGSPRSSRPASSGSTPGSCATCAPPSAASKHSGIGREGGVHSLEFYTETSNVCVKI